MLNYFPAYFTSKAIALYIGAIVIVFLLFFANTMSWYFYVFGLVAVVGFFYFSNLYTKQWAILPEKIFVKRLFITALIIRLVWVVFSYFFYQYMTGQLFEYRAADALHYHQIGEWMSEIVGFTNIWETLSDYWKGGGVSDHGYPLYLIYLYKMIGSGDFAILLVRIGKALLSAYVCVLIYNLAKRNFGESTGRIAAIFSMLMPHFIYYCGLHLKEMEMIFLTVAFVERADYVLRSKEYNFLNIAIPVLLAASLFFFRTVLGVTALMAFFTTIVFSSSKVVGWEKRVLAGIWVISAVVYFMGSRISAEVEQVWQAKDDNQQNSMEWRAKREGGNEFAKYAGVAVFAPLIFTMPFPTMVDSPNQENIQLMNGSNYVKNITSFFTIIGVFLLIYRSKWRENILILSFLTGYLAVIAMSAFAQSERFHLPSLPFALIIAAYGLSQMDNKKKIYYNIWLCIIFVAIVAWSWFKLAGRGLVD